MKRTTPFAVFLLSAAASLALAGCHTTVVQPVEQPAAVQQPAQPPPPRYDDHHDDHHPPPPPRPEDHRNDPH